MQILDSGLVIRHGFAAVGVAAHPEGHPDVAEDVLMEALVRKARWGQEHGVELYFATQFCFEPEPIIRWEARVRERLQRELGEDAASLPRIHLGVAGPAKIASLIKFATMSGVGQSIRFVTKHTGNAMKLVSTAAPDELIVRIASHQSSETDCLISGLHLYPFGGVRKTLDWANLVEAGKFSFSANGQGFDVA
jgi:methylenetetrahydrofolate reductase (NADPH)